MIVTLLVLLVAAAAFGLALRVYLRSRGVRVVECPETGRPAAVELDAAHATGSFFAGGDRRLRSCSRWPERSDCGQECLEQIEAAPDGCLLRSILTDWYAGKACVLCRRPIPPVHWTDHRPALREPGGRTLGWGQVQAEAVDEVLATHRPVCWNCHVAESFRREFPDRVLDVAEPAPDERRGADRH